MTTATISFMTFKINQVNYRMVQQGRSYRARLLVMLTIDNRPGQHYPH